MRQSGLWQTSPLRSAALWAFSVCWLSACESGTAAAAKNGVDGVESQLIAGERFGARPPERLREVYTAGSNQQEAQL